MNSDKARMEVAAYIGFCLRGFCKTDSDIDLFDNISTMTEISKRASDFKFTVDDNGKIMTDDFYNTAYDIAKTIYNNRKE